MNKVNNQIELQKAINPAYKKFKPLRVDIDHFKEELIKCVDAVKLIEDKNESEEHLKDPIKQFFKSTFYSKNQINTKGKIDLAIYLGETINSDVGVIIEAKKLSNKNEFISTNNLNKKALQEILLYYLRERVDNKNNNIKHLIITNGVKWFFFKGEDFYNYFYKNSALIKEYQRFRDGLKDTVKNELFYNEIASKYIDEIKDQLPFVYLSLNKQDILHLSDTRISNIYKLFSDVHLLGHSFGNDSNKLNETFYKELLHIIGLEEVKEKSKRVIVRKNLDVRDYGSLLENTIFTLEDKNYLQRVKNVPSTEEKSFIVGLELCITWINRVLFLKLLESQLVNYNKSSEYKFLNFDFLKGFDDLNDLFFSALAKPTNERHQKFQEKYKHIPYLNSSLFEHNEVESSTFDITALKDEEMEIYGSSVLKDANGKRRKGKLNTLEYLFKFLEAYDFSAEGNDGIDDNNESKTLINASVLGLIFEKINGYKDGSFYTPGYITRFMCKESIRQTVVDKFKIEYNADIGTFEDLKDYCNQFYKKADLLKFNSIINTLRICDPAVGSGHFLVSALNEVIAIKKELNILCNELGNRVPCDIIIENDELYITYTEGELFEYNRQDVNSLHIQQTLFHEKQTIIENCLFGVDINPNSVNICRLRLWIELLKNAYYTSNGELQTLPNIDINIKCGNSLISRFALKDSLKSAFKNKDVQYSIEDYKNAVNAYKNTNSKAKKSEVLDIISTIKSNFKATLDSGIRGKISKVKGEYENEKIRLENLELFGEKAKKSEKDNLKTLKIKADKITKEKEEILNNAIYQEAFEWRFEFPEVLDNNGNFLGFDLIIGNPPYIQLQKMGLSGLSLEKMGYLTYTKTGDIYSLFYELGYQILKKEGHLIFITSNKWMRAAYGESLRQFFVRYTNPTILIDFGGVQIFDTATVDTNILMYCKDKNRQQTKACIVKEKVLNNLSVYFEQYATLIEFNNSDSWNILSPIEKAIKDKIEGIGIPLKDWDININYGIKTGFNDAFIINSEKREELIKEDPKSGEIIRPLLRGRDIKRYSYEYSDLYLITTFPSLKIDIDTYPSIKQHLISFGYDRLKQTGERGSRKKTNNKWFEIQDSISYWGDFYKQKIIWKIIGDQLAFTIDSNNFIVNNACYILTGAHLEYILSILNSKIIKWYSLITNMNKTGMGDMQVGAQNVIQFPLPLVNKLIEETFTNIVNEIFNNKKAKIDTSLLEKKLEKKVYDLYKLDNSEISFIESL